MSKCLSTNFLCAQVGLLIHRLNETKPTFHAFLDKLCLLWNTSNWVFVYLSLILMYFLAMKKSVYSRENNFFRERNSILKIYPQSPRKIIEIKNTVLR